MKKRFAYLFNPIFVFGLVLLVVNDHILKDVFGNFLTGKLSDFAGVLILPFFIKFLFNCRKGIAILTTIVVFSFWKSPMSQIFIEQLNVVSGFHFSRVVDFSDLLAFAILPLSYYGMTEISRFRIEIPWNSLQQIGQVTVLSCTILAFFATTISEEFLSPAQCCVGTPNEANVGSGKIFIPTIFTPDDNGLNDLFRPKVDDNIVRVDTFFVINDATGELAFSVTNETILGEVSGFDGEIEQGIVATTFSYHIVVTSIDGIRAEFKGEVCCIPCIEEQTLEEPSNYANCAFADQHDFVTGYDATITPLEIQDCFE